MPQYDDGGGGGGARVTLLSRFLHSMPLAYPMTANNQRLYETETETERGIETRQNELTPFQTISFLLIYILHVTQTAYTHVSPPEKLPIGLRKPSPCVASPARPFRTHTHRHTRVRRRKKTWLEPSVVEICRERREGSAAGRRRGVRSFGISG